MEFLRLPEAVQVGLRNTMGRPSERNKLGERKSAVYCG